MPMLNQRILLSSLALPDARNVEGQVWLTREIGCDLITPWVAVAGQAAAAWFPQGPSYIGATAGLPAAADMRIGAYALIDETSPAATRGASGGVKMRRLTVEVQFGPDGTTKRWFVKGPQTLWQAGGTSNVPAIPNFTLTGTTGLIGEAGAIPAGLLATLGNGTELFWRALIGRGGTFAATATGAFTIGPTSGTSGTAAGSVATIPAGANGMGWLEGSMFVRASGSQQVTLNCAPQGPANIGSTGSITLDLTLAQYLQFGITSGTSGDVYNVASYTIGIR